MLQLKLVDYERTILLVVDEVIRGIWIRWESPQPPARLTVGLREQVLQQNQPSPLCA